MRGPNSNKSLMPEHLPKVKGGGGGGGEDVLTKYVADERIFIMSNRLTLHACILSVLFTTNGCSISHPCN